MKKVVLYNPKQRKTLDHYGIPLSLLSISSLLDKDGYKIVIIDNFEKDKFKKLAAEMRDSLCLGITSLTGYTIKDGLKIAKFVKSKYPNKPIIWGGWHPSILPQETLENPYADIVIRGQGERTFFEIVEALRKKDELNKILGLSYKKGGKSIHNPDRPFEDINNFPSMPYHLVNVEKYILNKRCGSRSISYVSSQGCPYRCGFCSEQSVYKRHWRGLKAERVVKELKNLVEKYKINGIVIDDENFFIDEERVAKIAKGIIDNNLNIGLGGLNGRARTIIRYKEETIRLLKKAGLDSILMGVESGCQDVLDFIKKDATVEEIIKAVKILNKHGIRVTTSTIIGFPTPKMLKDKNEIKRQFKINLEIIDKIRSINKNNSGQIFVYNPFPGTPLYTMAKQGGFVPPSSLEGWANFEFANINVPWVPKEYKTASNQFNMLYFPFMTNMIKNQIMSYGLLKYPLYPIYLITKGVLLLRWKLRFFKFPIEYKMLLIVFNIRNKFVRNMKAASSIKT